jgi:uncharacterized membrane protein
VSKLLFWIAIIGILAVVVVGVIAPATPDGSWLNELGKDVRDAMGSFFGNPVGVE